MNEQVLSGLKAALDPDPITRVLAVREDTHGPYDTTARIAQTIKAAMRAESTWDDLSAVQRESLDMIATKIARVLSGNNKWKDHWADIAGYSRLAESRCDEH